MCLRLSCVLLACLCWACTEPSPEALPPAAPPAPLAEVPVQAHAVGGSFYVPIYSHIYFRDDRRTINLAATLSIRNTDARQAIVLRAVHYYDSEGNLVRSHVTEPRVLGPMASLDFVVTEDDTSGGSGANFIVEWSAEGSVTEPVVEAVMISTSAAQGISFLSVGRPLERRE